MRVPVVMFMTVTLIIILYQVMLKMIDMILCSFC